MNHRLGTGQCGQAFCKHRKDQQQSADQQQSGPMREQHLRVGIKYFKVSKPSGQSRKSYGLAQSAARIVAEPP